MKHTLKGQAEVSLKSVALLLFISLPLTAFSQGAINFATVPYGKKTEAAIPGGRGAAEIQFSIEGLTPAKAKAPAFTLQTAQPIHEALQAWATEADWSLNWYHPVSWKTLRGTTYSSQPDVVSAVSEVIETLRFEGKPIALRVSDGNKVMEIISTEVRND